MVVKQQNLTKYWNTLTYWSTTDKNPRVPIEVSVHRRLSGLPKPHRTNILHFRGYDLVERHRLLKILMDYAPHGTLFQVINRYRAQISDSNVNDPNVSVPEPFIWYVARSLLSAIESMAEGGGKKGWNPIFHEDFKDENVALVDPLDEYAENFVWPSVQLIDFGLSRELGSGWTNPDDLLDSGTPCLMAPEQRGGTANRARKVKLSSGTDVFGLGIIIWQLGMVNHGWYYPYIDNGPQIMEKGKKRWVYLWESGFVSGQIKWQHDKYSKELTRLMTRCLSYRPEDRPKLADLREEIDATLEKLATKETYIPPDMKEHLNETTFKAGDNAATMGKQFMEDVKKVEDKEEAAKRKKIQEAQQLARVSPKPRQYTQQLKFNQEGYDYVPKVYPGGYQENLRPDFKFPGANGFGYNQGPVNGLPGIGPVLYGANPQACLSNPQTYLPNPQAYLPYQPGCIPKQPMGQPIGQMRPPPILPPPIFPPVQQTLPPAGHLPPAPVKPAAQPLPGPVGPAQPQPGTSVPPPATDPQHRKRKRECDDVKTTCTGNTGKGERCKKTSWRASTDVCYCCAAHRP
ncbi:kinase-like protein [Tothia fuscella]|uniref:non-specific serine/threonine protein kinase n=1 Tax=Tothia fuscella TaxID=1048955 RepID=A0A9P4NV17_9PEZI|nr:kinase-like protein [Tothia fuscella]